MIDMKLSKDVIEALLIVGAFAIIALAAWIVMLIWPVFPYGNWRVFLTLVIGGIIAVPAVYRLRNKYLARIEDNRNDNGR